MRAPISLDLHITNFNYPDTPADRLFEKVTEIATTAEASGFSSLSLMDHLHQIPPSVRLRTGCSRATRARGAGREDEAGQPRAARRRRDLPQPGAAGEDDHHARRHLGRAGDPRARAAWFEDEHVAYGFRFPPLKERFEHLEDALRISRAMFTQEARRSRAPTITSPTP